MTTGSPTTSETILEAARHVLATQGLAAFTVRKVASRAQVDPALLYHYFGSKDDVVLAATSLNPKLAKRLSTLKRYDAPTACTKMSRIFKDSDHAQWLRAMLVVQADPSYSPRTTTLERMLDLVTAQPQDQGLLAGWLFGEFLFKRSSSPSTGKTRTHRS